MLKTGCKIKANGVSCTDRRDDCRSEVFLRTMVSHGLSGRNQPIAAELVNIATAGFLIRTHGRFREGDRLEIILPKMGHVRARVIWSLKGCAGCEFLTSLEDGDFTTMLQAIRQAKPGWMDALPRK